MTQSGAVLVTGGAGYIGAHAVLALQAAGRRVVVLDDLSTGDIRRIPPGIPLIKGLVGDAALVERVLREHGVTAVLHFAGFIVAPASIREPLAYYRNNLTHTLGLLEGIVAAKVRHIIFSSSAAVYAPSSADRLTEQADTRPTTPYGRSKLMAEQVIADVAAAHDLSWLALRYFNVAGADADGRVIPSTVNATHLIAAACQTALGLRPTLPIYGDDYETPDGTCVRDYIHVSDLAAAHALALADLEAGGASGVLNCGYGRGVSVRDIAHSLGQLIGRSLPTTLMPRRPGDVGRVIADASELHRRLGWTPQHGDLDTMLRTSLSAVRRAALQDAPPV